MHVGNKVRIKSMWKKVETAADLEGCIEVVDCPTQLILHLYLSVE